MEHTPARAHFAYHDTARPMAAMVANWPAGAATGWHSHPRGQLLYAITGVMIVQSAAGSWVVPPNRALWLEAGVEHNVRMSGDVQMRTAFIDAARVSGLPTTSCVINVSPLLRELLVAAVAVPVDYLEGGRDDRLMRLLVDELQVSAALPLHLPTPADARVRSICDAIVAQPADASTAGQWAEQLGVSTKTIHRLFLRETGMTFAQWREQARLLFALRQIAEGRRILDVAIDSGYSSQSAFTAMFRRHFGVTPTDFYR